MDEPAPSPPPSAPPPAPAHHLPAAPLRTGLRLLLPIGGILVLLALAAGMLVAGLRWTVATENGSRWLIDHLPGVEVTGFKGALLGPAWRLDRLRVAWHGGEESLVIEDLRADGLRWQVWPGGGAWVGVEIASLTAQRVQLHTVKSQQPAAPFALPESIAPPLRLHLSSAKLDELVINEGHPFTAISVADLVLDPAVGGQHRIGQFGFEGSGVSASGSASITTRAPLTVTAALGLQPTLQAGPSRWGATLHAQGPLTRLALDGTLRGTPLPGHAAPALDLRALLQPLQPWPLASLGLQTQGLDLSALSPRLPATDISGHAELSGGEAGMPLQANVDLRNAAPGRWNERRLPVKSLSLRAERSAAQPDRLQVSAFDLVFADAGQPAGRLSGSALWQGQSLGLKTALDGVVPQRIDGRAAAMTLSGPVSLSLRGLPAPDGSVAAAAPGIDWTLDLDGRFAAAPQPVRLQLTGSADDQRLLLRKVHLESGKASADLQATLVRAGSADWRVQSKGAVHDFDPLPWWPGDTGSAWRQGRHRLSGDWAFDFRVPGNAATLPTLALAQRVAGNGHLRIHDSMLAGVPLQADITLAYTQTAKPVPGSLNAEIEAGGNRIAVEGRGDPLGSGAADRWRAEIQADALATLAPLARLSPALATFIPRQGSLTGSLSAEGRWPALHTEGNLHLSQLAVGQFALARGTAAWAMNLEGERPLALQVELAGLQIGQRRADNLRVNLHGTPADHHIDISGALAVLPPPAVVQLLGVEGQSGTEVQLQAEGSWLPDPAGGGRWRAHVERIVLGSWDGSATTAPSASDWVRASDLRTELRFGAGGRLEALHADPGRLQVSDTADLVWDAFSLDLEGEHPQGELHARIEPFKLAPLLARIQPDVGWQGDLRLSARVDIRAAEKTDVDLLFERQDGDLEVARADSLQLLGLTDLQLSLTAHEGLWKLEQSFRGRSLGEITGQVQVQTTPDRRWPPPDAAVQGTLSARVADLGIWGAWVPPGWRLSGALSGSALISGNFGHPQYSGEVNGTGLGVRSLLQGVNVHDGKLTARLAGDTATIEQFTLQGGDGRVDVSGTASLGPVRQATLKLKAEHFRLLGRVDRQIVVSGNAELDVGTDPSRLSGKFSIDEGLYDASQSNAPGLDDDVTVNRGGGGAEAGGATAASKPRRSLALDLSVDLGQKMHVLGRGLDTELRGELRVTNPGGRLTVEGTIRTEGGTYNAYGQKLQIERGIVAFGGTLDNPRLDILALRPNIDTRVGVQVIGTLQFPRVRLYSDPDMSDSDKLSWLMLGRAPDALGRNDAALIQQAALALLAGEGEAPTDTLLHKLGIDSLSLHQSDTVVGETMISLGKQLSDRWYFGYEHGVNAAGGNWQLIYRIAQRFTLRLQSGLDNSADVIWSWRFQVPPADAAMRKSTYVPP